MASMIGRLIRLARSPQGKRLMAGAQKAAQDPKNRQRLGRLRGRFGKRR